MFILSRRSAESVIVDGFNTPERALKVTVIEINGNSVRLAFEVNKNHSIQRSETLNSVVANARATHRMRRLATES